MAPHDKHPLCKKNIEISKSSKSYEVNTSKRNTIELRTSSFFEISFKNHEILIKNEKYNFL